MKSNFENQTVFGENTHSPLQKYHWVHNFATSRKQRKCTTIMKFSIGEIQICCVIVMKNSNVLDELVLNNENPHALPL